MFCVSRGWWYHDSDSTKEWNNLNNTVSAKLNKFLNHGAYKHAFTKLKEVLESFGIRVVSSFSFFRLKGLPSLSPHLKHYATPNMTMLSTRYFFLNGYPNAIIVKKHLCFLLLDPKISRGFPITRPVTHQPPIVFQVTWSWDPWCQPFLPFLSVVLASHLDTSFWKTTLEEKLLMFCVLCS